MRGISLAPDQISARAEGVNEMTGKLPLLKRIHVHYRLSIPEGTRAPTDRALASHVDKCPTAASLRGAVDITWSADIVERAGDA